VAGIEFMVTVTGLFRLFTLDLDPSGFHRSAVCRAFLHVAEGYSAPKRLAFDLGQQIVDGLVRIRGDTADTANARE
jgi:hypothetical protein